MKAKLLLLLAVVGILAGLASAYFYGARQPSLAPVFPPAQNPYSKGVYANGIIESYQSNGANINIFPEVSGNHHPGPGCRRRNGGPGDAAAANGRFHPEGLSSSSKRPRPRPPWLYSRNSRHSREKKSSKSQRHRWKPQPPTSRPLRIN